jgi:hypothetical protein
MAATALRPEERIKSRPGLLELERRELPAFTTPVFTDVQPVSPSQPVDWNLVASVRVTSDLAETAGGTKVTVTVQDVRTDNLQIPVTLLTYTRNPANSAPPGDISMQKLFSLDATILDHPGQVATLTATLPMCTTYQADVALGTLSPQVLATMAFPDTNIESVFGVNNNCCDCGCPNPPPPVSPPPPPCHNPPPPPCTGFAPLTQGYWKNHAGAWPVSSLTIGGITYTKSQLLTIFDTPVKGNGAIALAHQLIAAGLNVDAGASTSADVTAAVGQANTLLNGVNLLHGGSLSTSATSGLTGKLDAFNSSGH